MDFFFLSIGPVATLGTGGVGDGAARGCCGGFRCGDGGANPLTRPTLEFALAAAAARKCVGGALGGDPVSEVFGGLL